LLLCIDGYRKLQSFHSVTAKVSEYDPANTRNFIFLHNPICTYKSKRSRLPSISPFRHNHHTHTHTFMNALSLACLRHCYQTSSLKYVHGLHVQGVYFTAAPRMAAYICPKYLSISALFRTAIEETHCIRNDTKS